MRMSRYRPWTWAVAVLAAVASLAAAVLVPRDRGADRLVAVAAAAAGVEDDGADCAVSSGSPAANSKLPDPFTRMNGTRITSTSDWRCRRAEIRELAERSVYGQKPAKPGSVTGTVSRTGITVNVSDQGRSASFSATVDLPSGTGPFPAVVVLGGLGADTATIKASGAAVVSFDPTTVGREGTPRSNKQGAFYSIYGASSSTGLLMAWSWGVSRIIDVIEQSGGGILRADATGVTGCSRYGKGAFVAGAFDQRIALTMPIESGSGGTNIFRGVPGESGAQPLSSAYSEQPWLGDAFGSYTGNPAGLPVDTHQIVAMVAPRGLLVMENPHIEWLGARSGSVAALGGAEVYKALGAGSNISYWSDVQDGTHCAVRPEWRTPLQQSIGKFLRQTGSAPGVFRVAPSKSGSLSQWRDWTTPTLTDGGTSGGTTTGGTTTGGTTTGGTTTGGTTTGGTTTGGTTTGGSTGGTGDSCTAAHRIVNSWSGGYQGEVTVRNTSTTALGGWSVGMTLASGQTLSQVWNGQNTGTSGTVTIRNTAWNGSVAPGAGATFGFVVSGGSAAPANLTCAGS
ncbi:cellulose binding domain-containing protein [Streptomyces sp. NPDC006610]|uniref:glucuronyl esterase domain-containing protein n=1 Tax=Streptomyces sp. NPDC006610 TaxID=3154584 RepID=UPI0033BC15F2